MRDIVRAREEFLTYLRRLAEAKLRKFPEICDFRDK